MTDAGISAQNSGFLDEGVEPVIPRIDVTVGGDAVFTRSRLETSTVGETPGGSVTVDADTVTIDGGGLARSRFGLFSESFADVDNEFPATGKAGDITVTAREVAVTGGGQNLHRHPVDGRRREDHRDRKQRAARGGGGAGPTGLFSDSVFPPRQGERGGTGGDIVVKPRPGDIPTPGDPTTGVVEVSDGAAIAAQTTGTGGGGQVNVTSAGELNITNGGRVATSSSEPALPGVAPPGRGTTTR